MTQHSDTPAASDSSDSPAARTSHAALAVIGSGPAGVSAARAYLEAGGPGPVVMLTSDSDEPYERPPLSKQVLAGNVPAEGQPIEGTALPDGVELRRDTTVTDVDLQAHTLQAGGEQLGFDRLIVAAGASPHPLPTAEPDAEIHVLRSLDHAQRLVTSAQHARSAVVIGSGFIGCEAAASLARRGIQTTLVSTEEAPQLKRLGEQASAQITQWLVGLGVEVRMGVRVSGVQAPRTVHLDDGITLSPDLVLAAVGVTPGGGLLEGTEAMIHEGRVVADEFLLAVPGVWVAGDAARAHHGLAGRPVPVEHWGDALAMGEIAGFNAAQDAQGHDGGHRAWESIPGFWSTIGEHTIKYSAWGDGYESVEFVERTGGFTAWYGDAEGRLVGVLTYNADDDYERGQDLLRAGAGVREAAAGDRPAPDGDGAGEAAGSAD
ncbi:NAD(P)/FAD-dependent oxidoreductase [Micrococcus terreus]|uniref:NAD(P)/FAD-dependent oxidoreductase n=1 Tax=Micrococcus terreus TaxID=574650 RepID=UPI00254DEDB6|nr:FAD/NAD(P)-binding oxidoreductase [Micrococcus terreus]MDK7700137.1 FAD/NAD(P)-binding oxidoreductase [Micrococcus terreus]WOO97007.1 FAD/NAD(P)-binding oxidoreductase [Micrococcus terreus]